MTFATKKVAVLMASYNGVAHLPEQLASIARQTVEELDVWVSDDRSTDATLELLHTSSRNWPRGAFQITSGPGKGFAENFRSLLVNAEIVASAFAFSDQDDVWDDDKLSRALRWLGDLDVPQPRLYCGRTRTLRADGTISGSSPLFRHPPSFENALVQSIAGGNTMVMNRAARDLMAQASRRTGFVTHDWWCYMIVSGAGGVVHYDPVPAISYRQHGDNLVGENSSLRARLSRVSALMKGQMVSWIDRNVAGLESCTDLLTDQAREKLSEFKSARSSRSVRLLRSAGVYRQTRLGQIGLYAACLMGKL